MSTENTLTCITFVASGDLSSYQYRFVTLNSSGQIALAVDNDRVLGILQDKPAAAGRAASVAVAGISKCVFGGSVTKGAAVTTNFEGKAVAIDTSADYNLGISEDTGAAGVISRVVLQPMGKS